MDREEYLKLAAKYLNGECSPEEEIALRSYSDEISFDNDHFEEVPAKHLYAYNQLKARLDGHIETTKKARGAKVKYFNWIKIAAAFLVFASASIWIYQHNRRVTSPKVSYQQKKQPLDKNTSLILSDGERVALNSDNSKSLNGKEGHIEIATKDHIKYREGVANDQQEPVYHTITTPVGEQYGLELSDGSKIWLNARSSIKFPVLFNRTHRDIEITGEAYFEIAKNKEAPFTVSANGAAIRVLGTHFNVTAYPGDRIVSTTLLEGSVQLVVGEHKALLSPGKTGTINTDQQSFKMQDADIDQIMGWKNGLFVFRDENICEVMKAAARWYGVEVEVAENVRSKTFGGTVSQNRSLTDFMELIKLTGGVNYKITGRKVTVMK